MLNYILPEASQLVNKLLLIAYCHSLPVYHIFDIIIVVKCISHQTINLKRC